MLNRWREQRTVEQDRDLAAKTRRALIQIEKSALRKLRAGLAEWKD